MTHLLVSNNMIPHWPPTNTCLSQVPDSVKVPWPESHLRELLSQVVVLVLLLILLLVLLVLILLSGSPFLLCHTVTKQKRRQHEGDALPSHPCFHQLLPVVSSPLLPHSVIRSDK